MANVEAAEPDRALHALDAHLDSGQLGPRPYRQALAAADANLEARFRKGEPMVSIAGLQEEVLREHPARGPPAVG